MRSLSELRELEGTPIRVRNVHTTYMQRMHGLPRDVELQVGDKIAFTTRFIDAPGEVIGIDHGATYPIKVEWFTQAGEKRHTTFAPDEFINLNKVS